MDADAKFDPLILRHAGILLGHAALDFSRATDGINRAGKFTNMPSPVVLTMRPRWEAMAGSTRCLLIAFSRARVASSSTPMRRLYQATSAASTAARRRSTRSPVKGYP